MLIFVLFCLTCNSSIMHILPLPPWGLYSIRAQNGYGQHRPCKIVLLTLATPRGVTDLYLKNIAQARPMSVSDVSRSLQSWVSTTHRSYSQLTFFNKQLKRFCHITTYSVRKCNTMYWSIHFHTIYLGNNNVLTFPKTEGKVMVYFGAKCCQCRVRDHHSCADRCIARWTALCCCTYAISTTHLPFDSSAWCLHYWTLILSWHTLLLLLLLLLLLFLSLSSLSLERAWPPWNAAGHQERFRLLESQHTYQSNNRGRFHGAAVIPSEVLQGNDVSIPHRQTCVLDISGFQ